MILDLAMAILSSTLSMWGAGGLSAAAFLAPWLGWVKGSAFFARVVAVGALAAFFFIVGFRMADERAELKNLRDQIRQERENTAALKSEIDKRDRTARRDADHAIADAAMINELRKRINALQNQISVGDCFTDGDARRVLDLWRRPQR